MIPLAIHNEFTLAAEKPMKTTYFPQLPYNSWRLEVASPASDKHTFERLTDPHSNIVLVYAGFTDVEHDVDSPLDLCISCYRESILAASLRLCLSAINTTPKDREIYSTIIRVGLKSTFMALAQLTITLGQCLSLSIQNGIKN